MATKKHDGNVSRAILSTAAEPRKKQ